MGYRSSSVAGGNQASSIVSAVNLRWVVPGARRRLCATDVSAVVSLTTELGNSGRSGGLRASQPHYLATDVQGGGPAPILVAEVGFIPHHGMFDSVRAEDANGLGFVAAKSQQRGIFVEFLCRFFL